MNQNLPSFYAGWFWPFSINSWHPHFPRNTFKCGSVVRLQKCHGMKSAAFYVLTSGVRGGRLSGAVPSPLDDQT